MEKEGLDSIKDDQMEYETDRIKDWEENKFFQLN